MEENFEPSPSPMGNNENPNVMDKKFDKKSGKKGLITAIIVVLVVLLILAGAAAWWFLIYNSPKNIFVKQTDKFFEQAMEETDYKTAKMSLKMSATVESDDSEVATLSALLSLVDINLDAEVDLKNKTLAENLKITYSGENVIDLDYILQDEEMYIFLNDIFSKYLQIPMDELGDEEAAELLDSMFTSTTDKKAIEAMQEIIIKELKKQEYSKEMEKLTVDGKEKTAVKSTLKLTEKQFLTMLINIFTELKDNKDFMNTFKGNEEAETFFEDGIDSFDDSLEDATNEEIMELSIYTIGLKNEFAKLEFKAIEDKEELAIIEIQNNKTDDNSGTMILSVESPEEDMKITLKCKYKIEYDVKVSKTDISNAVNVNDLTSDDYNEMYENLQGTILYTLLENFGYNDFLEQAIKAEDNKTITAYGYKISYEVPETFEPSEYNTEDYKVYYTYDYDSASISIDNQTAEEYLQEIENSSIFDSSYYSDPVLGDIQTRTVDGNEFYFRELTYKSSGEPYKTCYVCSEFAEGYIYTLEVISEVGDTIDITPFLTISF